MDRKRFLMIISSVLLIALVITFNYAVAILLASPLRHPVWATRKVSEASQPVRKFLNGVRTNMFIFTKSIIYGLGLFLLAPLEAIRCQETRIISRSFFFTVLLLTGLMFFLTGQGGCLGNTKTTSSGSSTAPIVSTTAATNVNYNSATLNGTVNPNGFDTTYYFYWQSVGLASVNGSTTPQNLSAGTTPVNVSANVTSLSIQMGIGEYQYRIVASNSSGTSYGEFQSFNILP